MKLGVARGPLHIIRVNKLHKTVPWCRYAKRPVKPLWWIFSCKHKPKWISRHILISCTCSQIYVNSNSNYGTLKILHPYKFPIESSVISSSLVSQSWIFGLSRLSYPTTPTKQLSLSYNFYSARRFLPSTNQLSNSTIRKFLV